MIFLHEFVMMTHYITYVHKKIKVSEGTVKMHALSYFDNIFKKMLILGKR